MVRQLLLSDTFTCLLDGNCGVTIFRLEEQAQEIVCKLEVGHHVGVKFAYFLHLLL